MQSRIVSAPSFFSGWSRRLAFAACSYKHTEHTRESRDLIALMSEGISNIKRTRGAALS